MGLKCLEACKGQITTGKRGRQIFYEDEEYMCPKCGEQYVIGVTDDYEADAIAFLIHKDPKKRAAEEQST